MDHRQIGRTMWHDVYPPRITLDAIAFKDGLEETIPTKLEELLDRQDELVKAREESIQSLEKTKRKKGMDYWTEYFLRSLIEAEYAEYYLIQKWVRYWMRLQEVIDPSWQRQISEGTITDAMIEKASEYPIEELYVGRLRENAGKYTGLCPFHTETTPSFVIYTDHVHYHCFGCQANGDAIDFLMNTKQLTWEEAVKQLQ